MFIETLLKSARAKRLIRDTAYDERLSQLLAHGKLSEAERLFFETMQAFTRQARAWQGRLAEMQRICAIPTDKLPFKHLEQPEVEEEEAESHIDIASMHTMQLPAIPKPISTKVLLLGEDVQAVVAEEEQERNTDPVHESAHITRKLSAEWGIVTEHRATVRKEEVR